MGDVSFRFYASLNDFLPADRRGRRFAHAVADRTSVKDAIEALGVPHPEVDLILVNGRPEDFAHRLRGGDDVTVYPTFRSIDVTGVRRVGVEAPHPVRFALDGHLGKLAALLRLAGFDATIGVDDAELARAAGGEGRVVLTRDVGLLKRNTVRCGRWIRHTDPEWQLVEVLDRFELADRMTPFERCLRCNVRVVEVEAEDIRARLRPRTRAAFTRFHRCPACERIYWRGSHYDRMTRVLERARERVRSGRLPGAADV